MQEKRSLLSNGASIVGRNKRYVLWFYLLNLALATIGQLPSSSTLAQSSIRASMRMDWCMGSISGFWWKCWPGRSSDPCGRRRCRR